MAAVRGRRRAANASARRSESDYREEQSLPDSSRSRIRNWHKDHPGLVWTFIHSQREKGTILAKFPRCRRVKVRCSPESRAPVYKKRVLYKPQACTYKESAHPLGNGFSRALESRFLVPKNEAQCSYFHLIRPFFEIWPISSQISSISLKNDVSSIDCHIASI